MPLTLQTPTDGKISAIVLAYIDGSGALQPLASSAGAIATLGGGGAGSGRPYGADSDVATFYGSTNNIHTIEYKVNGVTVKTRTFTYKNGGVADNDTYAGSSDA